MSIYAYSLDTLGLPLGTTGIKFSVEVAGAVVSPSTLTVTSEQVQNKWFASNDGTNFLFVLRDGDYFYLVLDWKGAASPLPIGTATQGGKKTNMSQAQFVELFPMNNSLTTVQAQVDAMKRAFGWMDAT